MSTRSMALVRSIADAFKALDFEQIRDTLVEVRSMDELAATADQFGELMREVIGPDVEVHLHEINAAFMVGRDFHGWDGWLEFWRNWLEPWDRYWVEYSDWEEIGDTVLFTLNIEARGRGSGVEVRSRITQAWTVDEGKVKRLGMYASRRRAHADLGRG